MTTRRFLTTFGLTGLILATASSAAERTYEVGGDDKNTNITFESEADFETILGHTHSASGTVRADLDQGVGSVDVRVPVASLDTGIDLRNKHLQSGDWLDAKKHPEIAFVSRSARRLEGDRWQVEGDFTVHGVFRPVTLEATVRAIPGDAAKAAGLGKGDWLRVSAPFEVRLSEHGVEIPKKVAGRVNDVWKIRLNLFVNAAK